MNFIASKQFAAGMLFFGLGVAAAAFGWQLPRGQASQMGPGYFPLLLSLLLMGLGLVGIARAAAQQRDSLERWHWRRMIIILGSIGLFALLIERAGLVAAAVAIIVASASAAPARRWREIMALALGMAAASVGLFAMLLGLPLRLLP